MDIFKEVIRQSAIIDLTSVSGPLADKWNRGHESWPANLEEGFKPIFPNMWCEYTDGVGSSMGAIFQSVKVDSGWIVAGYTVAAMPHTPVVFPIDQLCFDVDDNGHYDVIQRTLMIKESYPNREQMMESANAGLRPLMAGLLFATRTNFQFKEHTVDEHQQRRCSRRFGEHPKGYRYLTLQIRVPTVGKSGRKTSHEFQDVMPWHVVRGMDRYYGRRVFMATPTDVTAASCSGEMRAGSGCRRMRKGTTRTARSSRPTTSAAATTSRTD